MVFLSTPSARRATGCTFPTTTQPGKFLSTPSARRATHSLRSAGVSNLISIHALREEGDPLAFHGKPFPTYISIHALREEGDRECCRFTAYGGHFYPRPPRGGRLCSLGYDQLAQIFLSTPSARRATRTDRPGAYPAKYFYPRPPRGGRQFTPFALMVMPDFYPRPPRGGRPFNLQSRIEVSAFLSTPSARRATATWHRKPHCRFFYPRPPRGGRQGKRDPLQVPWNFYPRPPRGGRLTPFAAPV